MRRITLAMLLLFIHKLSTGQVFFSEDFSGGIPVGWSNVDLIGSNVKWVFTTTGSYNGSALVDTLLSTNGTSASNGYLKVDSDSAGQLSTQDAVLTTAAMNCSGRSAVQLSFNEYFAQYLSSTGTVYVSNDSMLWLPVHLAHSGLGINQGTQNPGQVVIDISTVAAGQSSVYIRFAYHGEWDYWWFIDDVKLIEPPAVDLGVIAVKSLSNEYWSVPVSQASALTISCTIKNEGGAATTGGSVLCEVIDAGSTLPVYSESVSLGTMAVGDTVLVMPVAPFIPPSAGNYKSRFTISISGDGNSLNDQLESGIQVISDSVYARDDNNFAGTLGIGAGPFEDGVMGQNFRIVNADYLSSITFFLDEGFGASASGTPVFLTVHPQASSNTNPDGNTVLAISDTLLLFPGSIPAGGAFFTLNIQGGPLYMAPGLYFIGLHETDSILTIGFSNNLFSPGAVWVHWNSIPDPPAINGWAKAEDLTLQVAYMIRANLGNVNTSIAEPLKENRIVVYPNPANDHLYLTGLYCGQACPVDIEIYHSSGNKVQQLRSSIGSVIQINIGNLMPGIYFLRIQSSASLFASRFALVR